MALADADARGSCCKQPLWLQRLFAAFTAGSEASQERLYGSRKRALFADLHGDVLEIGPGTGANLPYLHEGVHWIGIEPNPYMRQRLAEKAARLGVQADLRPGVAERIDLAAGSVDVVLGTLVLCSVEDVAAALAEVRRVLKPGGRFVFLEHVAAPRGTLLRRVQTVARPIHRALGCHIDRETWAEIERAGFARVDYERFRVPLPLPYLSPHIAGTAVNPGVENRSP
jgi:SAM-dependent methyltransferase